MVNPVLTNECWLGYHDNCELWNDCDCMCHDDWEWEDGFTDGPTVAAIFTEAEEAIRKFWEQE